MRTQSPPIYYGKEPDMTAGLALIGLAIIIVGVIYDVMTGPSQ